MCESFAMIIKTSDVYNNIQFRYHQHKKFDFCCTRPNPEHENVIDDENIDILLNKDADQVNSIE